MSSVSNVSSTSPFDTSTTGAGATSAKAKAITDPSSNSSSSNSGLTSSVGSTFLNLLVQELQNQDPTSPMDSTTMVGQMISLNQLDQLMSINQDLSGSSTSSASGSSSGTTSSADLVAARAALSNGAPFTMADQSSSASNPNSVLDLSGLTNTQTTRGAN